MKNVKFYQASTSELFGETYGKSIFNEKSKFHPKSPYGVAKLYAIGSHQFIESYGILHVMVFYLITKVQEEVKLLLLEK